MTSLGGGQSRGSVRPIQPHRRHNLDMSQCVFTPMEDRVRFAAGWTEGAGRLDLDRQEGGHGLPWWMTERGLLAKKRHRLHNLDKQTDTGVLDTLSAMEERLCGLLGRQGGKE